MGLPKDIGTLQEDSNVCNSLLIEILLFLKSAKNV